jgi:hypothetical protein
MYNESATQASRPLSTISTTFNFATISLYLQKWNLLQTKAV